MNKSMTLAIAACFAAAAAAATAAFTGSLRADSKPAAAPATPAPIGRSTPAKLAAAAPADNKGANVGSDIAVTSGSNQFAFALYGKLKSTPGNVFYSPYSITSALAMVDEGARGQTASEIESVFHLPADSSARRSAFSALQQRLNPGAADYQLSVANALWAQQDYKFLPGYVAALKQSYGSEAANLDIAGNPEGARVTINAWVAGKTNDKIKDLFPPGSLNAASRLVLTNAVYFKGSWQDPFEKAATQDADFRAPSGKVSVPLMNRFAEHCAYTEDDSLQSIELPYRGGQLSMLILLPKSDSLGSIDASLNAEAIAKLRSTQTWPKVNLSLPRFTFKQSYTLSDLLPGLGMPSAFGSRADFSGMDGGHTLYISLVVHQAFVDVNEVGTEAAAATGVAMTAGAIYDPKPPKVFRADHPFVFFILDKDSGLILFMGRVENPK